MMKKRAAILILALAIPFAFVHSPINGQTSSKTVVYYFHGQFRCYSCTRIEELTRKALQKGFAGELAKGTLVLKVVNIDIAKNEHYINDYNLQTRSVVVSKISGGKEITWKNLDGVWTYLRDETAFSNYIISEVKRFIR